jgi:hypothetical protein
MESEALNMHDETGQLTKDLKLEAGNYLIVLFHFFKINSS